LQQFVALTSANPAKMYGLYPRKGTIAVGSDADLVIWNHKKKVVIRNADLHHNVDYTPYEGMEITGWPETTFVRGQLVQHAGVMKAAPGSGQFLPCGLPSHFGVNKVPDF
jgi:dihydropyrimidinase